MITVDLPAGPPRLAPTGARSLLQILLDARTTPPTLNQEERSWSGKPLTPDHASPERPTP